MVQKSTLYASARVKALENRLISRDRFIRMLEAPGADDVLKILYEISYAEGIVISNPAEYQKLLDIELMSLISLFESICPDEFVLHCFLKKYDYHNAKALVKAKLLKITDTAFMTYEKGLLPAEILKDYINSDKYILMPKPMAAAINKIDTVFASSTVNPRLIDIILNKAMYEDISLELLKVKDNDIRDYFISEIDITNLLTAIKCRVLQMNIKEYEEQFINGGSLNIKTFSPIIESTLESAVEQLRHTKYFNIIESSINNIGNNFTEIETALDNYLFTFYKNKRNDISSIYPLLNYYLIKQSELKNVKLIFTGIIGGADKAEIKKRLRTI